MYCTLVHSLLHLYCALMYSLLQLYCTFANSFFLHLGVLVAYLGVKLNEPDSEKCKQAEVGRHVDEGVGAQR